MASLGEDAVDGWGSGKEVPPVAPEQGKHARAAGRVAGCVGCRRLRGTLGEARASPTRRWCARAGEGGCLMVGTREAVEGRGRLRVEVFFFSVQKKMTNAHLQL